MKNTKPNKVVPYNIAVLDDDTAEINMYGDIYMETPRGWDGEPYPGAYIAAEEFLGELDKLGGKKNITVHINSGGGDLYAGLAIYNRLKMLSGHVTTINDGMAASAASLIFQAGDTRKMNKGSNLMAHGASGFLFGFYNIEDLQMVVKQFKAHNKAIVNVYAEAMGVDYEEAKGFVSGETWLTGQEAVDKGLADEVIEMDEPEDTGLMNKFVSRFTKNGINPPIMAGITPHMADDTHTEEVGGKDKMEIKNTQDLRAAYPDLVAEIENAAAAEAASKERKRIQGIEEIAASVTDKDMVAAAKFGDAPMTAEALALNAMKKQAEAASGMLAKLDADAKDSGAKDVKADPKEDNEEEKEEEQAKNAFAFYNTLKGGLK